MSDKLQVQMARLEEQLAEARDLLMRAEIELENQADDTDYDIAELLVNIRIFLRPGTKERGDE